VGKRAVFGAIASCLVLAACSSPAPPAASVHPWTTYQMNSTHNAIVPATFPSVRWTINLHSKINGGLAYDGRRLFAVDFAKELVAIAPRDGRILWKARGDDVLMSTPIVAAGLVFVGSGTNAIMNAPDGTPMWGRRGGNHWYAFRADDGRLAWTYATAGESMPSAAYVDGRLLFATGDGFATAVRADTGQRLWQAPLPGHVSMASTVVWNDLVYFVTTKDEKHHFGPWGSQTVALNWRTGKRVWSAPYGNSDCTPTVFGSRLFVEGVKDGPIGPREAIGYNDVVALDSASGQLRWRHVGDQGFYSGVGTNERAIAGTYDNRTLFQSLPATNQLIAFRTADGKVLWSTVTSGSVKMSPLVWNGRVYAGDTSGVFYAVDERSGKTLRALAFDKPFTSAPPIVIGRTMFLPQTDSIQAVPLGAL
jgi:outer membrane protein assembly factor BamB